jgi:hypothetical protein
MCMPTPGWRPGSGSEALCPRPRAGGAGAARQTRQGAAPGLLRPCLSVAGSAKPATRRIDTSLELNVDASACWRSRIAETQRVGVPLQESPSLPASNHRSLFRSRSIHHDGGVKR